ncbi:uncharacterized protein [Mobula birostris]|uniref:uncharacterized protein n=1 Tax=Mobula birostris TaxID=1983395 RepID=UPI003B2815A7
MSSLVIFSLFVSLLQSGFTQKNLKHFYIFDKIDKIVFTGLDIPGNGSVGWDWKPSYKQGTQQLVTFYKDVSGGWNPRWEIHFKRYGIFHVMNNKAGTIDLIITQPTSKFAGSIILVQREPSYEILKQYEIFAIKVVANPRSPVEGSDVTLSCTISRLPDTVSLHWKPVGSSQPNRRNTDQIRLNNTVYLMVRHVTVEDGKLYQCEVQENGNIVGTGQADFTVDTDRYDKRYTLYRSVTDHSEFHLFCYSHYVYYSAAWTWLSHVHQSPWKTIATALESQPVNVSESHFVNRLMLTETPFNGKNFSMRVFPVVFEDAGEYKCTLEANVFMTMRLITVKVTAEPSDTVTEGDAVALSCSVSGVTASTRLVWINGDGETVGDKTLTGEERSLSLIVQKADRGRGKWTCGVFDQKTLQLSVPYNLEVRDNYTNIAIIGSLVLLVLLLIIILGLVLCLKKCKSKDSGNQKRKPLQTGGNEEETSHLYSNTVEIQQMQGDQTPVTETSHVAEYMSVDNQSKQKDTEKAIHYGDIYFKNESSDSRHVMQGSNKSSTVDVGDSKDDQRVVIYAQIAQVT